MNCFICVNVKVSSSSCLQTHTHTHTHTHIYIYIYVYILETFWSYDKCFLNLEASLYNQCCIAYAYYSPESDVC